MSRVYGFVFFGCNLQCDGFGQENPTDPSTYELPYKSIDISGIERIEDLPVFSKGCDSSYSWSAKFKHLIHKKTEDEIADEIRSIGISRFGIDIRRSWRNPKTKGIVCLCFTGGEPMLYTDEISAILNSMKERGWKIPHTCNIETNATVSNKDWDKSFCELSYIDIENLHFSMSPKLYNVTGEKQGIKIDVIERYLNAADSGCFKFVVNDREETWDELDEVVGKIQPLFRSVSSDLWPIYVMPVGSNLESHNPKFLSKIADKAMSLGYRVSPRAHIQIYGNQIGT